MYNTMYAMYLDLILSVWGWRSMATIIATCSCHSSCCRRCVMSQSISYSFNKTAHLHSGRTTLCDFLSSQHPHLFFQIRGCWISPTLIWSVTRYGATGDIQQQVHQSQLHSIDELKIQRLLDVWHGMDQRVIDDAVDEWHKRLWMCVQTKGGHFKQLL